MTVAVYEILCLIWGSTWLAITYVVEDVPPVTSAAVRFWLAALVFLGVHLIRPIRFPRAWRTCLGMIVFGVPQFTVSYATVYWAEQHISSGMTSVLFAAFPFWVAGFSAWFLKAEPWTGGKLVGLVCGILGVGTVLLNPAPAAHAVTEGQASSSTLQTVLAVWGVLAATAVCGLSVVWIKRLYHSQDTIALTALQLLGGALGLTVVALILEEPAAVRWTLQSALATVYLAIFGSAVAFLGYYWLLQRIEGTTVATVTFVTPILALILGWLFRGERITWWLLVGSLLVLAGLRSVAVSGRKPPTALPLEAVECEPA